MEASGKVAKSSPVAGYTASQSATATARSTEENDCSIGDVAESDTNAVSGSPFTMTGTAKGEPSALPAALTVGTASFSSSMTQKLSLNSGSSELKHTNKVKSGHRTKTADEEQHTKQRHKHSSRSSSSSSDSDSSIKSRSSRSRNSNTLAPTQTVDAAVAAAAPSTAPSAALSSTPRHHSDSSHPPRSTTVPNLVSRTSMTALSRSRIMYTPGLSLSEAVRELSEMDLLHSTSLYPEAASFLWRIAGGSSFSTVSLTIVWVLHIVSALICFVLSDVSQSLSPSYPLRWVLLLGCHMNICSLLVVHMHARRIYGKRGYRFYQPFEGGQQFVLLQLFGIFATVLSLAGVGIFLVTFHVDRVHRGVLVILGSLGFIGSCLVRLSVRYFELGGGEGSAGVAAQHGRSHASSHVSTHMAHADTTSKFNTAASSDTAAERAEGTAAEAVTTAMATQTSATLSRGLPSAAELLALLRSCPNTETAMVVILMMGQLALSATASVLPQLIACVSIVNLILHTLNGFIIHGVIGCRYTPGYSTVMVRLQRRVDTAAYWLLWIFYLVAVGGNVCAAYMLGEMTPLTLLALSAVNATSSGALLLFVRTTSFAASIHASYATVFDYGTLLIMTTTSCVGLINVALVLVMQYYYHTEDRMFGGSRSNSSSNHSRVKSTLLAGVQWGATATTTLPAMMAGTPTRHVLMTCLILAQLFLLMLSPSSDIAGRIIHGEDFSLLYGHNSSLSSKIIQFMGWIFYTLCLVGFALFLSTKDSRLCIVTTISAVLSVLCITAAIRIYGSGATVGSTEATPTPTIPIGNEPGANDKDVHEPQPSQQQKSKSVAQHTIGFHESIPSMHNTAAAAKSMSHSDLMNAASVPTLEPWRVTYVLNGEMMVSYILVLASIMIDLVVDTTLHQIWGDVDLPLTQLLCVGDVLYLVALPLTHFSGRDKGIHPFVPFSGSGAYVALQAMSWMLYCTQVCLGIVVATVTLKWESYMRELLLALARHHIYCCMIGVFRLIPVLLITLSIAIEFQNVRRCANMSTLALDSFRHMHALTMHALETMGEDQAEDRNILRLAFRTLVEPTLQHYNIPYTDSMLHLNAPLSALSQSSLPNNHSSRHGSGGSGRRAQCPSSREEEGKAVLVRQLGNMHTRSSVSSSMPLHRAHTDQSRNLLDAHQRVVRHERMRLIIILLSCASATFYITAAFLSHFTAIALALIVCGELICTTACAATQVGYGMIVHGRWSNYTFFMPFRGGRKFLRWQLVGWWCYSSTFLVTLAAALESEEMSPWVLLLAALLSVLSQASIFKSILLFDPHPRADSFLEQNGEGVMALCAFSGAFLFTYIYQVLDAFFFGNSALSSSPLGSVTSGRSLSHGRQQQPQGEMDSETTAWWTLSWLLQQHSNTQRARLPFVVVMLSIALAVPCVFIALSRTTREWRRVAKLTARRQMRRQQKEQRQQDKVTTIIHADPLSEVYKENDVNMLTTNSLDMHRSSKHENNGDATKDDPSTRVNENGAHADRSCPRAGGNRRSRSSNSSRTTTSDSDAYSYQSEYDSDLDEEEETAGRADKDRDSTRSTLTCVGSHLHDRHRTCEMTNHLATVWATGITNTLEVTLILCGTLAPLTLMLIVYYLTQSFTPAVLHWVQRVLPGLCSAMLCILLLSFIPYLARVGMPSLVTELRVMFVTYCIYGMSVLTALVYFLPMLLWPRASTVYMPVSLALLSVFGSYYNVRTLVRIGVYAVIGYVTYRKCALYRQHGWRRVATLSSLLQYAGDVALVSFWLLYLPRYHGKPYYTESLRSPRFIRWARKYIFADMARYFRFRLIVDDPAAVQLRSGNKQFIFSFHPHGVFAGTALMCTQTREWAEKMGHAEHHHVTTHVATIVLNIPILRDFNLSLGSLSVSRPCIESSLHRGNSALIVTGGQAEMIHTRRSHTRMTLVTQHVGFIRMAIANRVPLVPLLSMAEINVMGLLQVTPIQRLTLPLLGFPFPVIPYGRFCLPVPYRTPLVMVVGKPVEIPTDADANNPEHVAHLAETYFSELRALFYRHRADAGYPNMELELRNDAKHKPAGARVHKTAEERSIEEQEKLEHANAAAPSGPEQSPTQAH